MLALGYYTVKQGTGIAARYIEARVGKPSLIQETSRLNLKEALKHPIKTQQRLMNKPKDVLKGVILNVRLILNFTYIFIAFVSICLLIFFPY